MKKERHRVPNLSIEPQVKTNQPNVTDDALNFQEPPQSPYAYPAAAAPAQPQPSPYSLPPSSPYSAPVPPPPPPRPSPSRYPSPPSSPAQNRMDEMQTQPSNNQPQLLRSDVSDEDNRIASQGLFTLILSKGNPNHRVRRSDMDASFIQEILGDTGVLDLMQSRRRTKRPEDDRMLDVSEMKQQLEEMERREQVYQEQILDLLESEKANKPSYTLVRSGSSSSDPVTTLGKNVLSDFRVESQ